MRNTCAMGRVEGVRTAVGRNRKAVVSQRRTSMTAHRKVAVSWSAHEETAAASRGNVCAASRTRSKKEQAYETMLVLRPDIMEEEQDQELAKMEAFLTKNGATDFKCMVRGRQRISYPIQGDWFGVYVLCTYKALPTTVRALEEQMSIPVAGNSQKNIVRQMTVKV